MTAEIALMTHHPLTAEEHATPNHTALASLITRARTGDAAAFDELTELHQRRVLSLAWRLLGNREDARDAAQETFLRLYKHLGKFDPARDFAGWLYRIVVNVCRDAQRKRRTDHCSLEAELAAGTLPEPASGHDTEGAALLAEEQFLLACALATLTEKERAALVLRDLEGLPSDEVAEILGSSPATVRSQISSARAKLRAFRARHHTPRGPQ